MQQATAAVVNVVIPLDIFFFHIGSSIVSNTDLRVFLSAGLIMGYALEPLSGSKKKKGVCV